MTPWIQHVSLARAVYGSHHLIENNTVLIQIVDKWNTFPEPYYKDLFKEIHQFDFQDTNNEGHNGISDEQAKDIARILKDCYDTKCNIVVHCHAGVCRSGAVAEVAEIMGFGVINSPSERIPNTLVKTKLLKELGFTHSFNEE